MNMIQNADWAILHWIQENLRCGMLDVFLSKLTLLGEGGAIWIAAALAMLATKKYRKYGLCLGLALVAGLLICNIGLKNIVTRPRPCWLEAIDLLVKNPRDYSFPSGHTWSAVTGAWVVTAANRKFGYAAIPLALLLPEFFGVMGIYWAEPIADIAASCTSLVIFLAKRKQIFTRAETA